MKGSRIIRLVLGAAVALAAAAVVAVWLVARADTPPPTITPSPEPVSVVPHAELDAMVGKLNSGDATQVRAAFTFRRAFMPDIPWDVLVEAAVQLGQDPSFKVVWVGAPSPIDSGVEVTTALGPPDAPDHVADDQVGDWGLWDLSRAELVKTAIGWQIDWLEPLP